MIKVGIVGATGYAGAELVRIFSNHPHVRIAALTTQSYSDKPFYEVYPHLYKYVDMACEELDIPALVEKSDVVFTALPHGHAVPVAEEVVRQGKKFIDIGADFRFTDYKVYEKWYKIAHGSKEMLKQAVYGMPELHREKIKNADIIGNPGCYPTGAILGLAPLMARGTLDPGSLIVDSKSGISGAGRKLSLNTHYSEINDNTRAYGIAAHRHMPEIEQELGQLFGKEISLIFTPHLVPMTRGILSTMYGYLKEDININDLRGIYANYYKDETFVRLLPPEMLPQTKAVFGSNYCDIGMTVDPRTRRVIVVSAIDNLVKGASGQAVQNMNLMCGLNENTGLEMPAIYP
ncbi:MAG: N-acetyl-gamma-glutamyl-phosphate reductase [Clostridiales bacterium]|nr:N-acetyl-gamma-glutamyl-phosphate reductase [Clostridiales bacterium]MCF8022429.1 N-acetyl-gamma-glutamyl-phosphate reductase [Clostridiales bacterium]